MNRKYILLRRLAVRMHALHWILTGSMAANLLVFGWAMPAHFSRPDGLQPGMRVVIWLGSAFAVAHVTALACSSDVHPWRQAIGIGLCTSSITLFVAAVCATKGRALSIAFSRDLPDHLNEGGPYRFLRHPFYTAYSLSWIAGAVGSRFPWLWLTVLCMIGLYWKAARNEEIKFLSSSFRSAYQAYRERTGMFLPLPRSLCGALRGARENGSFAVNLKELHLDV